MYQIILLIHVFIALTLIGLVLIQHGKGAQIGAAFGSGASQTVFGSQGTGSFLLKVTALFAAGFFTTSITLSLMAASMAAKSQSQIIPISERINPLTPKTETAPAPTSPAPTPNS